MPSQHLVPDLHFADDKTRAKVTGILSGWVRTKTMALGKVLFIAQLNHFVKSPYSRKIIAFLSTMVQTTTMQIDTLKTHDPRLVPFQTPSVLTFNLSSLTSTHPEQTIVLLESISQRKTGSSHRCFHFMPLL